MTTLSYSKPYETRVGLPLGGHSAAIIANGKKKTIETAPPSLMKLHFIHNLHKSHLPEGAQPTKTEAINHNVFLIHTRRQESAQSQDKS